MVSVVSAQKISSADLKVLRAKEDTLKNLAPAHDMGFAMVLVGAVHPDPSASYVDVHAADVKAFLRAQTAPD